MNTTLTPTPPRAGSSQVEGGTCIVTNVRLAYSDPELAKLRWNVECREGVVCGISQAPVKMDLEDVGEQNFGVVDGTGGVLLPSLCHAHIHLDKCFILDQCDSLVSGSLKEAMQVTNKAKASFPVNLDDLYNRASRLIRESVEAGVTVMRAHVEVDTQVGFECLNVGLRLATEWAGVCDVQVTVFAQEPLFVDAEAISPGPNYDLLVAAAARPGVSVVASAPYFEPTSSQTLQNIKIIFDLAQTNSLHADFHLDYNVDPTSQPLVWTVLNEMRARGWTRTATDKCVTIGHATRLGLFDEHEWSKLAAEIRKLPLTIVGLPQSDMYMMRGGGAAPRSIAVPTAWRCHGVRVAMSVNNVQNAFTPQGWLDPLTLASIGVGLFQVGVESDWMELLRSVTLTSKEAIGVAWSSIRSDQDTKEGVGLVPQAGDYADFVLIHETGRWQSTALSPGFSRTTILKGRVVATRRARSWNATSAKVLAV